VQLPVDPDVIAALEAVVDREPANLALGVHLASLLLDAGRHEEALRRCRAVLAIAPADPAAREIEARAGHELPPRLRLLGPDDVA
jgi:thioredoxin-like negative regulator of GroEL